MEVKTTRRLSCGARRDPEITSAAQNYTRLLRSELEVKLQSESKADGQSTEQCDQRHGACCLRQFFGLRGDRYRRWCRGYGCGGGRSRLDDRGYFHFFLFGRNGDDWNRLDYGLIDGVNGDGWNESLCRLGQLNRTDPRINEFLAKIVTRVEPSAESIRSIGWTFAKLHDGLARWLQPIVIDGEDGGDDLASVRIEDLDDVTVGERIQQLKRVRSGGKNFPGNFHGLAEGDDGFLVPSVCSRAGQH